MTETEKVLIKMQERFAREKDPVKRAAIRKEYLTLHSQWVADKSQLSLERVEHAAA